MAVFSPASAASWLTQRLGRTVSRVAVNRYIIAGDLPATNISGGQLRPHWVIQEADLVALAARVNESGDLPEPTGGWPQNKKRQQAASGHQNGHTGREEQER